MSWSAFDKIKPVPPDIGEGGNTGEIPQKLLDDVYGHIDNKEIHITTELKQKIESSVTIDEVNDLLDKDIVFNLTSPIYLGIQEDTEFLYPSKGYLDNMSISISLDSNPTSNVMIALQMYEGNNWITKYTTQLQIGYKNINVDIGKIKIDNNRLRLVILDGDVKNINNMNVVIKVIN